MADDPNLEIQRLHDLWRSGTLDDLSWFGVLRGPVTQSARNGIWRMTGKRPRGVDVDEAAFSVFKEFFELDPNLIKSPLGLARTIAFRRGQDVGRRLNQEKEFPTDDEGALGPKLDSKPVNPEDEVVAAEEAAYQVHLQRLAMACLDVLTPGQAEVIRATVLEDEELSDWALTRGKTYQAADQQRASAL